MIDLIKELQKTNIRLHWPEMNRVERCRVLAKFGIPSPVIEADFVQSVEKLLADNDPHVVFDAICHPEKTLPESKDAWRFA